MILILFATLIVQPSLGEKEEAMAEIRTLLQEGAHVKATKALKAYRRKHAETDEEKKEVDALLREAEGGQEFDDIAAEYRKKRRPRRAVMRLDALIQEYGDVPDIVSRAEDLRESLRSLFVLEVQDFEGKTDGDTEIITDPELVRHGERSVRWKPRDRTTPFDIHLPEAQDWTEYGYICAWIHNEKKATPATTLRISAIEGTLPHTWFEAYLQVDWTGWRNVRLPLRGKGGRFRPHGKPDWSEIGRIMIHQEQGALAELIIDDIRVEKITE